MRRASAPDSRDGFEKFYGIQRGEKGDRGERAIVQTAPMEGRRDSAREQQLEAQLQVRLSAPGPSPKSEHREINVDAGRGPPQSPLVMQRDISRSSEAADCASSCKDTNDDGEYQPDPMSRSMPPTNDQRCNSKDGGMQLPRGTSFDGSVPAGVPTFSISSSAQLPRHVQTYSLCAPKAQAQAKMGKVNRSASANIPQTFDMAARDKRR